MFDNLFFSPGLTYAKAFAYQYVLTALVYGFSALVFSYLLDLTIYLLKRRSKKRYAALQPGENNGEISIDSASRHLNENLISAKPHGPNRIFIKVLRVLSILISWYALLNIAITPSILSGLGIIPVWSSCIITLLIFVIKYLGMIYDLSSNLPGKDCTNFWKRLVVTTSMYRIGFGCFAAFAVAYSVTLPLVTANTCLNFFNKGYGVEMEGFGASTKASRHVQLSTVCNTGEICHVYSTLPEDGSTSIILNVHTGVDISTIQIGYEEVDNISDYASDDDVILGTPVTAQSFYIDMDEERGNRYMHSAYITGLTPNTLYAFEIYYNNQPQKAGQFRTLPSKNIERNFTIACGGDSGTTDDAKDMTAVLGSYDLDAILIGGDLVYDNGIKACYYSMDLFLNFFEGLNAKAERLIPLMVAVGNHDVGFNAFQGTEIDISESLFFNYFPQHSAKDANGTLLYQVPGLSDRLTYAYHVIGNTVHLTLDSGYLMPYEGVQVDFINNISKQYYDLAKFANFHVPMYPTCYNPDDGDDPRTLSHARQYWAPLFEYYNFSTIFENHMHLYKKTFPIVNGTAQVGGRGPIYLGDGNWGISPDDCYSTPNGLNGNVTGILEAIGDARHIWLVNISNETMSHWAVNETNGIFDQVYNVTTSNYINPKPIDTDL